MHDQAAEALSGLRWLSAEMLYQPPPSSGPARLIYEQALHSRLDELSRCEQSGVLLLVDHPRSAEALHEALWRRPTLRAALVVVNPQPIPKRDLDTPRRCHWPEPARWRLYDMTDRWARLRAALGFAAELRIPYLLLPSWDSVWGRGLLAHLERTCLAHAQAGRPAAVSPHTPWQHSPTRGAGVSAAIVRATVAAFNRQGRWLKQLAQGKAQALWGKMSLIPWQAAALLCEKADWRVWEDDRELDAVLQAEGYPVRAVVIEKPALYRQALSVFTEDDLLRLIERHLHYTLDIPDSLARGATLLSAPLSPGSLLWERRHDPRWQQAIRTSERLLAQAQARIRQRLEQYGCSWVDWGRYRLVAQPGQPFVQVWKSSAIAL
ncbi:MAG: hypothetical protein NZ750_02475 [Anaerolineae bacterium]|nr:hypothetical protein [Anaerolineae bacterium]MDW8173455.1 hypothetical protein [Anaerolineae bacterium]